MLYIVLSSQTENDFYAVLSINVDLLIQLSVYLFGINVHNRSFYCKDINTNKLTMLQHTYYLYLKQYDLSFIL